MRPLAAGTERDRACDRACRHFARASFRLVPAGVLVCGGISKGSSCSSVVNLGAISLYKSRRDKIGTFKLPGIQQGAAMYCNTQRQILMKPFLPQGDYSPPLALDLAFHDVAR